MYKNCIFCHGLFRRNQVIEHLPLSRRIAYDPQRGRLWAICHRCAGWNLVPFTQRWEALEECERAYERTSQIVHGDEISLARIVGGVDLVRVGRAGRSEFAAWRYGRQLSQRRRRRIAKTTVKAGGVTAVAGAMVLYPPLLVAGVLAGAVWTRFRLSELQDYGETQSPIAIVRDSDRKPHAVFRRDLGQLQLGRPTAGRADWILSFGSEYRVTGPEALTSLGRLMPLINRFGGRRRHREDAVTLLDSAGSGEALLADWRTHHSVIRMLPRHVRLALEMAAHEEGERIALAGDLFFLEEAWRQAETLAAISDNLLIPAKVLATLARMRANRAQGA
jgi:hypothetical protein